MGFNQIKVQILFTFLSYLPGTFAHKLTIFSPQKRHRWFCINILFKETKPDIFYHNHSLAIFSVYLSGKSNGSFFWRFRSWLGMRTVIWIIPLFPRTRPSRSLVGRGGLGVGRMWAWWPPTPRKRWSNWKKSSNKTWRTFR